MLQSLQAVNNDDADAMPRREVGVEVDVGVAVEIEVEVEIGWGRMERSGMDEWRPEMGTLQPGAMEMLRSRRALQRGSIRNDQGGSRLFGLVA